MSDDHQTKVDGWDKLRGRGGVYTGIIANGSLINWSCVAFLVSLLTACKTKHMQSAEGLIEFVTKAYDGIIADSIQPVIMLGIKVWYKDSLAIEENASLNYIDDSQNNRTRHVKILSYRFNDLRTRSIYEYGSFSDTARLISKYSFDDTTIKKIGGWGFNQNREYKAVGNPQPLADTIYKGIEYSRLNVIAERENVQYKLQLFFNCEGTNEIFNFDPTLSKKIGCPCTKLISTMPDNRNGALLLEDNYLRHTLSSAELKVFDVWEKFARMNPVGESATRN